MSTITTALLALVTFSSTFQTPQTAEDPAARAQAVLAALAAKDFARIEAQFDDRMKAFDHDGKIGGLLFRPAAPPAVPYSTPPYANPVEYTEREVTVGSGEWMLLLQLNHLFIAGGGKSLPAEYETAGHVDEAVVRDIAEWIKK